MNILDDVVSRISRWRPSPSVVVRVASFLFIILSHRITFFGSFLRLSQTKTRHSSYDRIDIWFVFLSECFSLARRATWLVGFNTYNTDCWLYFWRNGMGKNEWLLSVLRSLSTTIRKQASRDSIFELNKGSRSFSRFVATSRTKDLPLALIKFNLPSRSGSRLSIVSLHLIFIECHRLSFFLRLSSVWPDNYSISLDMKSRHIAPADRWWTLKFSVGFVRADGLKWRLCLNSPN